MALIAFACNPIENILWFAFEIFSVTGGATLGVFLLGVLTKRRSNRANVIAMISSTSAMIALLLLSKYEILNLAWSWLIVIGTAVTFILGYFLQPLFDKKPA